MSAGNEASRENTFIFCYMNKLPHHHHRPATSSSMHNVFLHRWQRCRQRSGGRMRYGGGGGEKERREREDGRGRKPVCLDMEMYLSAADHGHHGPHSGRMSPPTGCYTPAHKHTSIKGVVHPRLTFCTFNTPKSSSGIFFHTGVSQTERM